MPDVVQTSFVQGRRVAGAMPEIVIGCLIGISDDGSPLIDWPDNLTGVACPAISTAECSQDDIGNSVALLFADGDPSRPVIVGLIRVPGEGREEAGKGADRPSKTRPSEALVDGKRVVLKAEKEIVLRCGKASITLTRAGRIIQRGTYVLSRSSGANKIKGGSIELN